MHTFMGAIFKISLLQTDSLSALELAVFVSLSILNM